MATESKEEEFHVPKPIFLTDVTHRGGGFFGYPGRGRLSLHL